MPRPDALIRASEVGQYAYCARSWWLGQVKGLRSTRGRELAEGRALHLRHGQAVVRARRWRTAAWALTLATLMMGILLVWTLLQG